MVKISKISNDDEYTQCLVDLHLVFDAEPDTADGIEAARLVDMITEWEDIHYKID